MKRDYSSLEKILKAMGYTPVFKSVNKNGIHLDAVCIESDSNISPCIYIESILDECSDEYAAAEQIVSIYLNYKDMYVDISFLDDREYILNNIFIGLQPESTGDYSKRNCKFEDIEEYLYIRQNDKYGLKMVKINETFLNNLSIHAEDAWKCAEKNTFCRDEFKGIDIWNMLKDGRSEEMMQNKFMFAITNKITQRGAVQIFNKKCLKEYLEQNDVFDDKVIALPSSIHEFLIIPYYTNEEDIEYLDNTVQYINSTQVSKLEQLGNRSYILDLSKID